MGVACSYSVSHDWVEFLSNSKLYFSSPALKLEPSISMNLNITTQFHQVLYPLRHESLTEGFANSIKDESSSPKNPNNTNNKFSSKKFRTVNVAIKNNKVSTRKKYTVFPITYLLVLGFLCFFGGGGSVCSC